MHSPTPSLLGRMVLAAALASAACSGGGGGDGGGLSLGQSSVSFAARQGGPVPAPQSIAVTVTASQAAYIVAGYPPGTPEPTWLSVSLGGSGANWSLSLSIAGTYFAPGTRTTLQPLSGISTVLTPGTAGARSRACRPNSTASRRASRSAS